MPVFALYEFDDADTIARDSALGNGAQNGIYLNGAAASSGEAVLDGEDDLVKLYPNPTFQMDRGTLDISFTLADSPLTQTQTLLSRDSAGTTDGGYRIEILADGAIVISHETATGIETFGTALGFAHPGDEISLSYSWDQGGAGGRLVISNATTGDSHAEDVPNTLTMDMSGQGVSQPWMIGAGQANSDPNMLNNIDQHFAGSVSMFQLSDTVDNKDAPDAVDDVAETDEDTPVTIAVLANDSDPTGQPLTVIAASAPNGTVSLNPDGTITYTPAPDFNGEDTITYTVRDPDGNQDSATVTVCVHPVNDAPDARDDASTTAFNTPVTFAVLGNDTDVDGDVLTILGTPSSADGTVTVNGDGSLTFTPNAGFTGDATVSYQVTDGNGGTDTATWTITVQDGGSRDGIVWGTTGDDLIDLGYANDNDGDFVDAGDAILPGDAPEDDRIMAGSGNDTVAAGQGDDSVEGGTGNDLINGQNGEDTLFGQAGDDTLIGQNGNDTIYGGDGSDSVRGGTGDDFIDTSRGGLPLPDQDYPGLYGADADPNDDRDSVRGGEGNDTILTGDDRDVVEGGYGDDLIDAGFDDDYVTGNQGNDTITGGEGNDTIDAGWGDDLVYGGYGPGIPDAVNIPDATDLRPDNGRDLINGGLGNDTLYGMDDDDTLDGGQDNDLIYGGIDEDSIRGNVGDDRLFGDEGSDTVSGGQGNDTITGGAGADLLSGEADRDDFLVGSAAQGNGDTVHGGAGGDDFDRLILTGAGPYRLRDVVEDSDGNGIDGRVEFLDADGNVTGSLAFTNIEEIVPCFTPGTLIATPKGEVPVESLKAGDRVITRDNGLQEIRWIGQKALGWKDLAANPHLKPVLIRQGSLGNGLPERDMMVSPNHRMLVANDRTALYFDEHEVLVAAKHLVAAHGIQSIDSIGTTYVHFMFDRHEVVLSNGAWTESFQPGDMTLKGMGNAQRSEILELFPELKTEAGLNDYQAARRTLRRHEARLLVK